MVELKKANLADYIRFVMSTLVLVFCLIVTVYAIVLKKTLFWDSVPGWVALLLFMVDIFCLGIVEGLQIALVELKRQHPDSYRKSHPRAYNIGESAFSGDNVERFLMGRQVFVVFLVFFAAKLTTIYIKEGDDFLFPAPWWFRTIFLETGILGCIVLVIIAQLMPQIVAAKYPVHFLQFIIMKPAYYLCIGVEMSGLTHVCWLLSAFMQFCFRMKDDKTTINPVNLSKFDNLESSSGSSGSSESNLKEDSTATTTDNDLQQLDIKVEGGGTEEHSGQTGINEKSKLLSLQQNAVPFSSLIDSLKQDFNSDIIAAYRQYLDKHPEQFMKYPSVVGNKVYASPGEIALQMRRSGLDVPMFLLDISHPDHIPPHIVACELMATVNAQKQELHDLKLLIDKENQNPS